jgi:hypothetical protein
MNSRCWHSACSGWLPRAFILTALAAGGCSDGPEHDLPKAAPETGSTTDRGVPGAVYSTNLSFVGFSQLPALLHLRFENRTNSSSVALDYRGWIAPAEEWLPVLTLRDSLPVPRAAWRVLPVGPLRLKVGDGAEISSLRLEIPGTMLRLDAGPEISTWASVTGQRETLRLAHLHDGQRSEIGLLLSRQRARRVNEPPATSASQYFLMADTVGDGLLILRDGAFPDAPATAWSWFDGVEAEWPDVSVLALSTAPGSAGRWSVQIPEAGIFGEIEATAPELDELPEVGGGFRIFRLSGALLVGADGRTVAGLGVEERER